jgi:hypothetical protein
VERIVLASFRTNLSPSPLSLRGEGAFVLDAMRDASKDARHFVKNLVVRDAQNREAEAFQVCLPLDISGRLVLMDRAIHLNNQAS